MAHLYLVSIFLSLLLSIPRSLSTNSEGTTTHQLRSFLGFKVYLFAALARSLFCLLFCVYFSVKRSVVIGFKIRVWVILFKICTIWFWFCWQENMWLGLLVSEYVVSWLLFVLGVSGNALQALRSRLSDPTNALQSWDPALVSPCTWFHVTCDSNNHVTRL